jgi:hypothetical protein
MSERRERDTIKVPPPDPSDALEQKREVLARYRERCLRLEEEIANLESLR